MEQTLFQLSQGHLQMLSRCPRRYQYTHLDQLLIPNVVAHAEADETLGQQFHLLMQQYWLGLDIAPILAASPPLNKRFEAFQSQPPEFIAGDRLTEHRRMLRVGRYLLVGVFDLLVLNAEAAQIIDWKSYRKPKSSDRLGQSWQTRLYLYLLTKTSGLRPENLSMTYWFAATRSPHDVPTFTFRYSKAQHNQTHQQLLSLLHSLDRWRVELDQGQAFPRGDHCEGDRCPCQRSPEKPRPKPMLDFDSIPELPLPFSVNSSGNQPR